MLGLCPVTALPAAPTALEEASLELALLPLKVSSLGLFCRRGDKGAEAHEHEHGQLSGHSLALPPVLWGTVSASLSFFPSNGLESGSGRRVRERERLEGDIHSVV